MNHRDRLSTPPEHADHDPLLVARLAGDDLAAPERAAVERWLASCDPCRELHADLLVLARATADLPVPRRTRDFRLSPEQARSSQGSWLQRLAAGLALPRLAVLQPLAGAAMALGLFLVVLSGMPQAGAGGAPTLQAEVGGPEIASAAPSAAAGSEDLGPVTGSGQGAAEASTPRDAAGGVDTSSGGRATQFAAGSVAPTPGVAQTERMAAEQEAPVQPDWFLIGLLLLAGGLAVLAARILAVRQMRDPRLH
jgi:hypothetical protein